MSEFFDDEQFEEESIAAPELAELFTANERTIQAAHDTYQPQPDFVVPAQPRPESRSGAVETRQYNPQLLQYAAKTAGFDTRRLIFHADGSITIANHPPTLIS